MYKRSQSSSAIWVMNKPSPSWLITQLRICLQPNWKSGFTLPTDAWATRNLSWTQLQVMAARLLGELPAGETEIATTNVAPVAVSDGTAG